MRFPYLEVSRGIFAPIISLEIWTGERWIICEAYVNSGATYTIFHTDVASVSHGCPCGFYTDPKHECTCTPNQIQKYRAKLSVPLLDRIDLQIEVPGISFCQMSSEEKKGESSVVINRSTLISSL